MKKALAVVMVLCLCGCSDTDKAKMGKAADLQRLIAESIAQAEPVVGALETATGKTIPVEVSIKGERYASKTSSAAKTVAGVVTALGQPEIGGLIAAFAALAGGIGTFFHRRKAKKIALAASRAVDSFDSGGRTLMAESAKLGVADDVNAVYQERKGD